MELPDFLEFEAFNTLRERMGTDQLGYFEVFDPTRHLTGEERAELRTLGVRVVRSQLRMLGDHTLSYKNSRIAVITDDHLHVTRCKSMETLEEGLAVSGDEAWQSASEAQGRPLNVCADCLHQLRFAGLDLDKERKQHHNRKVIAEFSLSHYFSLHPDYPLYEKTHVRHSF